MEGEAVKRIEELALKSAEIKEVYGEKYSPVKMIRIYSDPRPAALKINSLTGLIDYVNANVDGYSVEELMIHVVDHERVDLITCIQGETNERHTVLTAVRDGKDFPFEKWIEQEDFIIKVRSLFAETDDRADILFQTSKIKSDAAILTGDDGVKQNIQIKKGISGALVEAKETKPIVRLKPNRTFPEIGQPESDFLFRMKEDRGTVYCALFEADNADWKNEARKSIGKFLEDTGIVIIA